MCCFDIRPEPGQAYPTEFSANLVPHNNSLQEMIEQIETSERIWNFACHRKLRNASDWVHDRYDDEPECIDILPGRTVHC